jgi:tetratricopeptide (TPR) repeat protein
MFVNVRPRQKYPGKGARAILCLTAALVVLCCADASPTQGSTSGIDSSGEEDPLATGRVLARQGMTTEAERFVRQYLESHPNSADAHFLLGYILFKEVKAKESLAEYTEGAKYRTPAAVDLKVVALNYVLLGDYVDADKWLTRSLELTPSDSEGWYYLGRAKYNENRFEEAVNAFDQCLKLDRKNVKAEDNRGLSLQGLSRNHEAIAAYRTAISWQAELQAKNPGPFINLGSLLMELNRPEEAIASLNEALAIPPETYRSQGMAELEPRAHEQLGRAYMNLNQLPQAQAELEKAVALVPQDAHLHYLLGQAYRKGGRIEKAKAQFDRYTELVRAQDSVVRRKP